MFTQRRTIQLHDTDAYGILFFANQFRFCHDAFQEWLRQQGLPMAPRRERAAFVAVVVRAEADYSAPVELGDELTVAMRVAGIGTTSFTSAFTFTNQRGVVVGRVRLVQVTIDPASTAKMPIPANLRTALTGNQ
jgi:1,4-dihydroxy-2-naphthoyl-CoA hydrolase